MAGNGLLHRRALLREQHDAVDALDGLGQTCAGHAHAAQFGAAVAGLPKLLGVADARPAQWRKVIFNASTNPIGALTGLTHGRVCERPGLRALVSGLVDEGKAVAAALEG